MLAKDPKWVADISEFYHALSAFGLISDYFTANPDDAEFAATPYLQAISWLRNGWAASR